MPTYEIKFSTDEYDDFVATTSARARNVELESNTAEIDRLARSGIKHCDTVEVLKAVLEQIRKVATETDTKPIRVQPLPLDPVIRQPLSQDIKDCIIRWASI